MVLTSVQQDKTLKIQLTYITKTHPPGSSRLKRLSFWNNVSMTQKEEDSKFSD